MVRGAGGTRDQGEHSVPHFPQSPRRFHRTLLIAVACAATGCQAGKPAASGHRLRAPAPTVAPSQSPSPTPSAPQTPPPATAGALAGRIIVLDPGHNGMNWAHPAQINALVNIGNALKACDTTGTAANDGYTESAFNLDVANRLAGLLRARGATVILTRNTDTGWGPCITQRAAIANQAGATVALSIHADGSVTGRGFHVIYPAGIPGRNEAIVGPSTRLAGDLRAAYAAGTGMPYATYIGHDGLDQRSDLGGLNLSQVPKVFIESGNLRNPTDAALLESPAFRQREAEALAAGLENFLDGK